MSSTKIAVLTGAAGVIGNATTMALLQQGTAVIGIDINGEKLNAMKETHGAMFEGIKADLGNEPSIAKCCASLGPIDILINNVGVLTTAKFLDTPLSDLRRTMALNLESAYLMSQHLIPGMKERGQGRIINISSFAGRSGGVLAGTAYSLSKAAMIGLTFCLAREFGPSGISVNAVAPAFVRSPMMASAFKPDSTEHDILAAVPLRRLCEPEEVASAIAYLASDLAGFINGEVIDINGGIQCD